MKTLSVIVPVLNEVLVIDTLVERLTRVLQSLNLDSEIIFVNDGSSDETLVVLRKFARTDRRLKIVSFSRNFGHQSAVMAGIDYCTGDCAVIIDADLQDPPELIPEMVSKWEEGNMVVYAQREVRKGESAFKRATAKIFYRLLRSITNVNIPMDTGDFRLIDRKVMEALKRMPERNKFLRGMIPWIGFKQVAVKYTRQERFAGTTKYPLRKMIRLALDGITSFSTTPLYVAAYAGFFITFITFLLGIYVIWLRLFTEKTVAGWTSTMLSIFFLGGVQLIFIGIIGIYMGRVSDEVKNRPQYLVEEEINFDK
jgi:dolichol-phosphate mannosyltransferase